MGPLPRPGGRPQPVAHVPVETAPDRRGVRIEHHSRGYVLLVPPSSVDVHRFRALVAQARAAPDEDHALALLDQALGTWRGEPLAGLESSWADGLREVLESERHAAELDRTDLRLRRGEHHALLAALAVRAAGHPLDERLAGQFMLALYRCGRQAEALAHYDGLRRRLAGELGVDAIPALRELHQRILRASVDTVETKQARADTGLPAPRQLPAAVPGFTGRAAALAELDALPAGRPAVAIRRSPVPPGWARPRWPCTGRTGSRPVSRTGSSTSTCAASTRRSGRCHRRARSAVPAALGVPPDACRPTRTQAAAVPQPARRPPAS